jgi:phytoene/squalene synthetase
MSQVEETLSLLERSRRTHEEIRKEPAELSLRQKFVALRVSEALAELLPSERRAALDVIKQRDKHSQLDLAWLAGLLKVLKALKAQEE